MWPATQHASKDTCGFKKKKFSFLHNTENVPCMQCTRVQPLNQRPLLTENRQRIAQTKDRYITYSQASNISVPDALC